jgi:hypothetical protein
LNAFRWKALRSAIGDYDGGVYYTKITTRILNLKYVFNQLGTAIRFIVGGPALNPEQFVRFVIDKAAHGQVSPSTLLFPV